VFNTFKNLCLKQSNISNNTAMFADSTIANCNKQIYTNSDNIKPKISIIVPIYNVEKTLKRKKT